MRFVQLALFLFTFTGIVIAGDTTTYPRPLLFSDHRKGLHAKTFWDPKGRIRIITTHRSEELAQRDFIKLKSYMMNSNPETTYPAPWAKQFDRIDVDVHPVTVKIRSVSKTNRVPYSATRYAISLNLGALALQLDPRSTPQPDNVKAFAIAMMAFIEAITSNFDVAKELMSVLIAENDNSWEQGYRPGEGPDPLASEDRASLYHDANDIPPYDSKNIVRPPRATQQDMDRWWAFYWSEIHHNSGKLRSIFGTTEQFGAFLWDRYWDLYPPKPATPPASGSQTTEEGTSNANAHTENMDWERDGAYNKANGSNNRN